MRDRNQKQRRHIRAAREWLGEAEHSLAENHRVRGELKVMLAKAELARVEGTPGHRLLKKWTARLLPACAALFIAAGGWWFVRGQAPSVSSSYPSAPAVQEAPQESAPPQAAPEAVQSSPPVHDDAPLPEAKAEAAVSVQPQMQPVQESTVPDAVPAEQQVQPKAAAAAAQPQTPKVPDDGMQKLMQTAGKTLRK